MTKRLVVVLVQVVDEQKGEPIRTDRYETTLIVSENPNNVEITDDMIADAAIRGFTQVFLHGLPEESPEVYRAGA